MAIEKAKIQKIREDQLSGKESKKAVYPKTLDKAVYVQNTDTLSPTPVYETLDKALKKKWRTAWSYTINISTDPTVSALAYYLFSFSTVLNKVELQKYVLCTLDTFRRKITEAGNEEDIENLDTLDSSVPLYSKEDLERRLSFKTVKSLYLDCIKLHDTSLPEFVIIDSNGNEYGDGDTIELTEYPAKLKLKLKTVSPDFAQAISNLVNNFPDLTWSYDFRFESYAEYSNYKVMETYSPNGTPANIIPNSFWHSGAYKNPLDYYGDYMASREYKEYTINYLINAGLEGRMIDFYVRPSDYPTTINDTILEEYCSRTREGILVIRDYVTLDGEELRIPLYIKPLKIKLIFNPSSFFTFLEPQQGEEFPLNKKNNFINEVIFKAKNVDGNATIALNFTGLPSSYAFFTGEDLTPVSALTITPAQLTAGYHAQIRPSNWNSASSYLPFNEAKTEQVVVNCDYIVDNVLVERRSVTIKCTVREEDLVCDSSLEGMTREFNTLNNTGYIDVHIINGTNDPIKTLDITSFDVFYLPVVGTGWNQKLVPITNYIVLQNNGKVNGEFREEDYHTIQQTINYAEQEISDMSFKVVIPAHNENGDLIMGDGYFIVYINGITEKGKELVGEYRLDFSIKLSELPGDLQTNYRDWLYDNIGHVKYVAVDSASAKLVNSIVGNVNGDTNIISSSNVITDSVADSIHKLNTYSFSDTDATDTSILDILSNITEIPDGAFANNPSLTSVVIPNNITKIGRGAFMNCPNLRELVIPDSVEEIGYYLAYGCTSLETVDFGVNIHWIMPYSFIGCPNLRTIICRQEELDGIATVTFIGKPIVPAFDAALDEAEDLVIYFATDAIRDSAAAAIALNGHAGFFGNNFTNATILTIGEEAPVFPDPED